VNRALLLAWILVAAPAAAQAPAEKPSEKPTEQPKAERPALNLRLDNPSSFATTASPEKPPAKGLPALGGDARRIEPAPGVAGARSDSSVYPKDTNPGR
jgi:hypothetical protein